MARRYGAYLSPKLQARRHPKKGGWGVFAHEPVAQGELLLVWAGDVINYRQLLRLPEKLRRRTVQVEEGLYQVSTRTTERADYINHSCRPNAGMSGQIALVALRDIEPGEEVCFDYAMCDGSPYDQFVCQCGEPECRGLVTGSDWSRPDLWDRYRGFFSPYLQRRIDSLLVQGRVEPELPVPVLVRRRDSRP
jgi:hypothetical protein